jgi:hypothetical protein
MTRSPGCGLSIASPIAILRAPFHDHGYMVAPFRKKDLCHHQSNADLNASAFSPCPFMRTENTTEELFIRLEEILCPWLGPVYQWMPSNPADLFVVTDKIRGCGFGRLAWQKNNSDPDWILAKWRTCSGVICPRCQTEIQALEHSRPRIGGPFVFCQCIRLEPSRFPSLKFFTRNWRTVLEALNCFELIAAQSESERQTCRAIAEIQERTDSTLALT